MLSVHCQSVTLLHCGQTVGWIKMKLQMEVGLGPGHIALDGDPAPPPPKGHSPQFSAHVCCGKMAGWIKMPLGTKVGLGPGHIVSDGDPAPPPKRGTALPNFWPTSIVAKRSPISATVEHLFSSVSQPTRYYFFLCHMQEQQQNFAARTCIIQPPSMHRSEVCSVVV